MGVNYRYRPQHLQAFQQAVPVGQLVKGSQLAQVWNVSERTVYRRISYLRKIGIRIRSEQGVGYWRYADKN